MLVNRRGGHGYTPGSKMGVRVMSEKYVPHDTVLPGMWWVDGGAGKPRLVVEVKRTDAGLVADTALYFGPPFDERYQPLEKFSFIGPISSRANSH